MPTAMPTAMPTVTVTDAASTQHGATQHRQRATLPAAAMTLYSLPTCPVSTAHPNRHDHLPTPTVRPSASARRLPPPRDMQQTTSTPPRSADPSRPDSTPPDPSQLWPTRPTTASRQGPRPRTATTTTTTATAITPPTPFPDHDSQGPTRRGVTRSDQTKTVPDARVARSNCRAWQDDGAAMTGSAGLAEDGGRDDELGAAARHDGPSTTTMMTTMTAKPHDSPSARHSSARHSFPQVSRQEDDDDDTTRHPDMLCYLSLTKSSGN